jgi:hypothetical protein
MKDELPAFMYLMGNWNHEHPRDFELHPKTGADGMPRFVWQPPQDVEFDQLDSGDILDQNVVDSQLVEDFSALVAALATVHQRTDFAFDTARLVTVNDGNQQGGEVEIKSEWARQWDDGAWSNGDLLNAVSVTWQTADNPLNE